MKKSYTYVMSDIHGQYDAFIKMLKKIKLKDSDILYVIGDVIDRGPNSIKTLLYIMEKDNIYLLAGNHEYMATLCLNYLLKEISNDIVDKLSDGMILGLLEEWNKNGGGTTLNELFSVDKETRNSIFNYLTRLKLYKELEIG
ncbi:MAG: metallophosphoesterase, partial [Lachnospiraceae bacterium]|nr:metallophosphoesterase [Lachnospiraceae bacterium]